MKNRFCVAFVIASSLSNNLAAEPITLRSGDHDGFTRLVMELPSNVEWDVIDVPGKQIITFSGHNDGFETRRVFDIIPRNLLTDIWVFPSKLELELSCDCQVNYFVELGSYLVVDIIDGPLLAPETSGTNITLQPHQTLTGFGFGELMWTDPERKQVLNEVDQISTDNQKEKNTEPARSTQATMAETTRERLLKGVMNAANRGLVQASLPEIDTYLVENETSQIVEVYDSSDSVPFQSDPRLGNLRITNSRDIPSSDTASNLTGSGAVCPDPKIVQVSNWGQEASFHEQTSKLRKILYSETDKLNEKIALDLARLYIFFGFGAEAKKIIRLSERLELLHPEILDLADIVDLGFTRNPRMIHRFSNCNSDGSLWAILAARTTERSEIIDANPALRTLSKLPSHLRDHLAPKLSDHLSALDKNEAASIALRRMTSKRNEKNASSTMAKARINQSAGETSSANTTFLELSQADTKNAPEALIAYIESRLPYSSPIEPDISLLIDSYAFEFQGNSLSIELNRTQILAAALSNQFAKAFQLFKKLDIDADDNLKSEILSQLFIILSKNATDIDFLDITFQNLPNNGVSVFPKSTFVVARRLFSLGFANFSQDLLTEIPNIERDDRILELSADIYVEHLQPTTALTILDSIDSQYADEIKARAYLLLGQNNEAADLFEASNMLEEAQFSAWLADDWAQLSRNQSLPFEEIQKITNRDIRDISISNRMIVETLDALEESGEARSALNEALQNLKVLQ